MSEGGEGEEEEGRLSEVLVRQETKKRWRWLR
jgi:hypothetical protein